VKLVYVGKPKSGGNGDIQKCFIEGDPAIPKHWKFATKTQKGDTKAAENVVQCQGYGLAIYARGLHQMDCSSFIQT
jgi:hypothetical protein